MDKRYYCVGCKRYKNGNSMYTTYDEIGLCKDCFEETYTTMDMTFFAPENVEMIVAPFLFKGVIKDIVKEYKFSYQPFYGELLGTLLYNSIKGKGFENGYDMIVPIPLHKKRLFSRGFNQSRIIADVLGRNLGIEVCHSCVKRIKNTEHQSMLQASDRVANVEDAFKADSSLVKDKNIILVDDIVTIGYTVRACAKALQDAGAKRVMVFSVCKTDKRELRAYEM